MPPKDSSNSPDLFAGMVQPTARLQTRAKDLVAALKLVKKFAESEKKSGEALLGFDGTHLAIELAGVTWR